MGEYSYDAQNRRVYRKADEDQSGSQETELYYVLDGNRVIEERVYSDEDLKRDYWYGVYIDEPVFARADLNDDNDFSDTDEQFYYLHNTQYSVHAIIDTSGSIIEVYKNYQPYGAVSVYTGDGGDGDWWDGDETTGSLSGNYYLFTGRRHDPEADLMFYRNRMYSTSRGRFLQRDPIGYVDGLNLYRAYFVMSGVDALGLTENPFVPQSPEDFIEEIEAEACIDYCGPDVTAAFRQYIIRIFNQLNNLDDSQTGAWDGAWTLSEIGMNIDFWYRGNVEGCATRKCTNTVWFCGKCVRDTAPNNVLYGIVAAALDVGQTTSFLGANWADPEHDEGTEQQGAYDIGYELWHWVRNPNASLTNDSMCQAVNNAAIETITFGEFYSTDSFEGVSRDFEDCKSCGKSVNLSDITRLGSGFTMGQ